MTERPLVTAIGAVYNEEEHLSQCLESLRERSYRPLEIIVADDGSTDKSADVARRFPEARLLSLPHLGKAQAVNPGAERHPALPRR